MPVHLENSAVATGLKRSVFFPIPKKGNAKECSNCCTTALISHASKVTLKILQARLQQYANCEIPDVEAGFRKGRGTRDQIINIHWIIEKGRGTRDQLPTPTGSSKKKQSSRKTSTFAPLTTSKTLTA